jgi:hypothetical protein
LNATITEMIYVKDVVLDGTYLLICKLLRLRTMQVLANLFCMLILKHDLIALKYEFGIMNIVCQKRS